MQGTGRCFGIVAQAIIHIDWPPRSVVDKAIVASSTCYSSERDMGKEIDCMQRAFFGRNYSAPLPISQDWYIESCTTAQ